MNGLALVAHVEFAVHVADMGLYRQERDAHLFCAAGIALALGEPLQQFLFSGRELERAGRGRRRARQAKQMPGQGRADRVLTAHDLLDRLRQLLVTVSFKKVAARARPDRRQKRLFAAKDGGHQDRQVGITLPQLGNDLDPRGIGQSDVDERQLVMVTVLAEPLQGGSTGLVGVDLPLTAQERKNPTKCFLENQIVFHQKNMQG